MNVTQVAIRPSQASEQAESAGIDTGIVGRQRRTLFQEQRGLAVDPL